MMLRIGNRIQVPGRKCNAEGNFVIDLNDQNC